MKEYMIREYCMKKCKKLNINYKWLFIKWHIKNPTKRDWECLKMYVEKVDWDRNKEKIKRERKAAILREELEERIEWEKEQMKERIKEIKMQYKTYAEKRNIDLVIN